MNRLAPRAALVVACLAFLPNPIRADDETPFQVDEVLRGVWRCQVVSKDRGRTFEDGANVRFARVSETQARTSDGRMHAIDRILMVRLPDREPVHCLRLSDGVIWVVTKVPGNPHILLRVLEGSSGQERCRMIFVVER